MIVHGPGRGIRALVPLKCYGDGEYIIEPELALPGGQGVVVCGFVPVGVIWCDREVVTMFLKANLI